MNRPSQGERGAVPRAGLSHRSSRPWLPHHGGESKGARCLSDWLGRSALGRAEWKVSHIWRGLLFQFSGQQLRQVPGARQYLRLGGCPNPMWVWILGEDPMRGKKCQKVGHQHIFDEKIHELKLRITPQFRGDRNGGLGMYIDVISRQGNVTSWFILLNTCVLSPSTLPPRTYPHLL